MIGRASRLARLPAVGALLSVLAACGGVTGPTLDPRDTPGGGSPPATTPAPTSTAGEATPSAPAVDFVPGSVRYRVVNLTDQPVDAYVRSQRLVAAWPMHSALGTGEVSDYVAPPDPGTLVITTAGAGDPTCVGDCPHFLASIGNTSGNSTQSTVVVHPEGVTDYWEQPNADDVGQVANALLPPDPSTAILFAIGRAVVGADFGLRLGFVDDDGCAVDVEQSNLLVGGTTVQAFAYQGEVEVTLHDPADTGCEQQPLGGPFTVAGDAGSRTLLLLYGSVDEMEALALPIP